MKTATKAITAGIVGLAIAGTSLVTLSGQGKHEELDHALVSQASVTMEQAKAIALAEVSGSVIEVEIEHEDDVLVWEVEVLNAANETYEFEIDANDGRIVKKELDD